MDSQQEFRFSVQGKLPPGVELIELTAEKAEKLLLEELEREKDDPDQVLRKLAWFCGLKSRRPLPPHVW